MTAGGVEEQPRPVVDDACWQVTVVRVPRATTDVAAEVLRRHGADAVEIREATCHEPGSTDEDESVELCSMVHAGEALRYELLEACGPEVLVHSEQVPRAVTEEWRRHARATSVGPLTIAPAWLDVVASPGRHVVRIDPEHLFGLGDHPTTLGVLAMLLRLHPAPSRIVDAGCGSGVLGIAAAAAASCLGRIVPEVRGFDTAPDAAGVVGRNCSLNAVTGYEVVTPEVIDDGWADVTVANILAPVLIELAPTLTRITARGGQMILGGMTADQWPRVVAAYPGAEVAEVEQVRDWSVVRLVRET